MISAQLTAALDRAVAASPRARALCLALEGRRVRIDIHGVPLPLLVTAAGGSLQCTSAAADPDPVAAEVTVSGSPFALLAVARGDASAALANSGVSIGGEQQLVQQFQELARLLRPDFEAIVGRLMGRIPAHLAARAVADFTAWGRAAGDSLLRNAASYLAHESRDLVSRAEAESFLAGVEALRAPLAAAESRAAVLAGQLAGLTAPRSEA